MSENVTPMVKQYLEIKSRYKDAIVFYRLGDFYEMFNEDAITASRELELVLTGRGEGANRMPMCGLPYHAARSYIAKLVDKGYKVAICEQIEDPATAKGVVKRDVVKLITPGTIQDEVMLDQKRNNYLLSISNIKGSIGIAYADSSTGGMFATVFEDNDDLLKVFDEIKRVSPSEILVPDIASGPLLDLINKLNSNGSVLTTYKDVYDKEIAVAKLKEHFKVRSLDSFGIGDKPCVYGALISIIDYLKETQKGGLGHINSVQFYVTGDFMYVDNATSRNLELVSTIRDGSTKGSLLWVLDRTSTAMGARMLRNWVLKPLLDPKEINLRLDAVEELVGSLLMRDRLSKDLEGISDIERLNGRISSGSANARDMVALRSALKKLSGLKANSENLKSAKLSAIKHLPETKELIEVLERAIADEPPITIKEGAMIKPGFNKELDEVRDIAHGGKQWISELEYKERARTGIKSLKVGFTSVFGYYIEISKANATLAPSDYTRKQTLVNCERYVTPELKEKESLILNAEARMNSLEYEIFKGVRESVSSYSAELQKISFILSEVDALCSFARTAVENKYSRPKVERSGRVEIKAGRHPVVELTMKTDRFISNDTDMDHDASRTMLITGPNMAGKSTYMRQAALILLMAQTGSFVPAASAALPIIDRVFTRIGAMDDIFSGQSTFMVEMTETANILNNATKDSFIILDEIGRGTSTFDGMSIAAAVAEHIHEKICAYTMFATHYHEITQLADKHKAMVNYNTLVKKEGDGVIFLHKIVKGAADQSYGIEVAKLAGLPNDVVSRAKEIYATLEMVETEVAGSKREKKGRTKDQMGLF
jgi:DNA mismatch repair protein MutS